VALRGSGALKHEDRQGWWTDTQLSGKGNKNRERRDAHTPLTASARGSCGRPGGVEAAHSDETMRTAMRVPALTRVNVKLSLSSSDSLVTVTVALWRFHYHRRRVTDQGIAAPAGKH
jgi:hypothetical protein